MAATQVNSFPWGPADLQSPTFAATLAITITNAMTVLTTGQMTSACTINLTLDQGIKAGSRLLIIALSDGTARTITFGTGFTSGTMAGVISKTKAIEFVYDGTTYKPTSGGIQID